LQLSAAMSSALNPRTSEPKLTWVELSVSMRRAVPPRVNTWLSVTSWAELTWFGPNPFGLWTLNQLATVPWWGS
jgi:hypothetical protein